MCWYVSVFYLCIQVSTVKRVDMFQCFTYVFKCQMFKCVNILAKSLINQNCMIQYDRPANLVLFEKANTQTTTGRKLRTSSKGHKLSKHLTKWSKEQSFCWSCTYYWRTMKSSDKYYRKVYPFIYGNIHQWVDADAMDLPSIFHTHIEARTKWLTFCRHFQMQFL